MDDNFSPRVKDVITFSKEEALRLGHDFIGTEHLILGLIRNGEGKALLDATDSSSSDAGSFISMEDATDASSNVGNALQYNFGQTSYFISIINETAGSNGKIYVQEVAQHDSI